ncbi:hypothetical protein [Shewanella halifaxensis]|uniref:hypothetical protein n=1 Tax=Shewanella halifaxensis TaxID=271098 RepID=UPI000D58ED3B|nr:hypothetical protein [Shewanella halifaxensis]
MKILTTTALVLTSALTFSSNAEPVNTDIEHINVVYRTPFEYSLYLYTQDTLQAFSQQLREEIPLRAKQSSLQMAKAQGFIIDDDEIALESTNSILSTWRLKAAE